MISEIENADARLLNAIQQEVPLVRRPFERIGQLLDMDEAEVLRRLQALKTGPGAIIRQISAIFDSRSLGYASCLVAARVDESRIDAAAEQINGHPGVSHNYRRNHEYNLWYTLAVPPDSRLGLQRTVEILHRLSGAVVTRLLPALKVYKIGVKFDLGGQDAPDQRSNEHNHVEPTGFIPTPTDKRMIRVLQEDLPIQPRPFDIWAEQAGVSVDELLEAGRRYQQCGCMRRFSAVLRHRQAGFSANAMGAWIVPLDQQETFGKAAAGFSAVSHCYLRPTYEDWPYSIFTMVHGRSTQQCEQTLAAISAMTGVRQYVALYSTQEYKKVRVKYFTGLIESWEDQALAGSHE